MIRVVRVVVVALAVAVVVGPFVPATAAAQQIPGRRLEDVYLGASFHDDYWAWYHEYLQRREEQRQRTTEIRLQLGVIAMERKKLRAQWLKLLYLENQLTPKSQFDSGWTSYAQSFFAGTRAAAAGGGGADAAAGGSSVADVLGTSSVGELAGELRRQVDDAVFRWTSGVWGAPLVTREDPGGAQLEASYQGERDLLRTRINEWKETQGELIDEALGLNRELAKLCGEQKEKSGDARPWLNAEVQRIDDELPILEVYLYDAAQWYLPDELPALVEALDLEDNATEEVAALLRAKLNLAQANWNDEKTWLQLTSPRQAPPDPAWVLAARAPRLQAIVDLRRVLELDPDNAEARGMLVDAELYWLREIAAKLDLERRASVAAFREYMSVRGFYADQPADWSEDLYEVVTAFWGLGPIALTAGLPGLDVAGARATELDVTQTRAAMDQVAMLAIMRLVKNGVPLREIPAMTPDELAEKMTLHTADGRRLPADKARRTVQDIRETFADLPDLRLLASSDPEYLVEDVNRAFGTGYYAPLDPTYTWYESFGDLLNVHNVAFLWGPGSIVRMNGELVTLRYLSGAEIEAAEAAGTLFTGRQAFLQLTRLDRLAETIASTTFGRVWATLLKWDAETRGGLGTVDTALTLGSRLSASVVLYSSATYLAQQAGVPGAALLVELLGEIGPGELFADVVRRAGVPLEEVKGQLDDFGRLLIREQQDLAASRELLEEVSDLAEELAEESADAARRTAVQKRLGEIAGELEERVATRPPATAAQPVDDATKSAVEALQNGNVAEAERAVTGAFEIAEGAGSRLDEARKLAEDAIARVDAAAGAPPLRIIPAEELPTVRQRYGQGGPDKFWRPDLYADPDAGLSLQLGDQAIRDGNLDAAVEHFRAARRQIYTSRRMGSLRPQLDHAEARLDLVVNAQRAGDELAALRQSIPPSNAVLDIDEQSAREAFENLDRARSEGSVRSLGGANPVWLTQDNAGNAYYVKAIEPDPEIPVTANLTPEDAERILSTEVASANLARRLDEIERAAAAELPGYDPATYVGLNSAAARYDPERRLLISRAVPQESALAGELASRPEHVALAFRREYAQQRVFRTWLGDADGHLDNMIVGDDGRLYQIDFDQAVLSGTKSRQIVGGDGQSERDLMLNTVWTYAVIPRQTQAEGVVMYQWIARLDQTITYEDMRPTVEAIRELAGNPDELRRILTDAGYPDVEGAVRSLTERANDLERLTKGLFDGALLNVGSAWMPAFNAAWIAALGPASLRRAA